MQNSSQLTVRKESKNAELFTADCEGGVGRGGGPPPPPPPQLTNQIDCSLAVKRN